MMKEAARPDKDGGGENLISNLASGLCFDFSKLDPTMYLAGTESGMIYKCSCSYYDAYTAEFTGHEPGMPVYKIRWSPFAPNIFLSCSADWTVKLWKDDNSGSTAASKHLISFSSSNDYVADIRWAPTHSTVFGSVTGDGKLDIWDVEREMCDMPSQCFPACAQFCFNLAAFTARSRNGRPTHMIERVLLASQSQPDHFAQLGAKTPINSAVWRGVSCSNHGVERYDADILQLRVHACTHVRTLFSFDQLTLCFIFWYFFRRQH